MTSLKSDFTVSRLVGAGRSPIPSSAPPPRSSTRHSSTLFASVSSRPVHRSLPIPVPPPLAPRAFAVSYRRHCPRNPGRRGPRGPCDRTSPTSGAAPRPGGLSSTSHLFARIGFHILPRLSSFNGAIVDAHSLCLCAHLALKTAERLFCLSTLGTHVPIDCVDHGADYVLMMVVRFGMLPLFRWSATETSLCPRILRLAKHHEGVNRNTSSRFDMQSLPSHSPAQIFPRARLCRPRSPKHRLLFPPTPVRLRPTLTDRCITLRMAGKEKRARGSLRWCVPSWAPCRSSSSSSRPGSEPTPRCGRP